MILEIKNFLDNPYLVRDFALSQNYEDCNFIDSDFMYSGFRSEITSLVLTHEILSKIENLTSKKIVESYLNFHINTIHSVLGFPHRDNLTENTFAGVIYLNELSDEKYGTTLYHNNNIPNWCPIKDDPSYIDKMQIVYSLNIPIFNSIKKKFVEECLNLKKNVLKEKMVCKFEFNKLILYDANVLHSPNFYFGESLEDSRMTISLHGVFEK